MDRSVCAHGRAVAFGCRECEDPAEVTLTVVGCIKDLYEIMQKLQNQLDENDAALAELKLLWKTLAPRTRNNTRCKKEEP